MPPEKAIRTLNAFVLFSVLSSDRRPFKIPTMTARIRISPAEHTKKDMLDNLFRDSDVKVVCSSRLRKKDLQADCMKLRKVHTF